MTKMKKLAALLLALVMVLAMSSVAFAAETMNGEDGVIGEHSFAKGAFAKVLKERSKQVK